MSDKAPESEAHTREYAGLSRSAIIIGLVSLLSDTSTEMIYPLVPVFLTQTLRAPVTVVGLIEGIAVGTASIVTGFSGWISDRIGRRKPVAFAGYSLTALSRPLIALAGAWPVVLAARFADRFGKGIRSAPKDALLAETSAAERRGRAFGFERAMDFSGAVVGPLIALSIVGVLSVRSIFLVSCIPAAVAALLILTLREHRGRAVTGKTTPRLSLAGTTRAYRRLLLIAGAFGLANSANAFLILRAGEMGLSTQRVILAYLLYNAVAAGLSMPAGALSDRVGRRNLLASGYVVYAVVYAGFAMAGDAWVVWPLFIAYGFFPALTEGMAKALAVDTAGGAGRATALGVLSMVTGLAQICASYIGGALWDGFGSSATFGFGAGLAGLAAVLVFLLLPRDGLKLISHAKTRRREGFRTMTGRRPGNRANAVED